MLRDIQIIYENLYRNESISVKKDFLTIGHVIAFLTAYSSHAQNPTIYQELIIKTNRLRSSNIDPFFIERFCLSKISNCILQQYPVNIGEAYVLSYLLLTKMVDRYFLHFKLGTSGLLSPTLIDKKLVEDPDAIAQFILASLVEAELIIITENNSILPGTKFKVDSII